MNDGGPKRYMMRTERISETEPQYERVILEKDYDTLHQAFVIAMKELHIARRFIDKCKEMVKVDEDTTILAALDDTISDRTGIQ